MTEEPPVPPEQWVTQGGATACARGPNALGCRITKGAPGHCHCALFDFTKALVMELSPFKTLSVSAPEVAEAWLKSIPLHRFAEPAETDYLTASLASDKAHFITSQGFRPARPWDQPGLRHQRWGAWSVSSG